MRLSQIKIAGFKSFVDPTVIPTLGDLIGIVGPNGCGKSNVIDAVRWVLGESKASALRGESMQDVIFSGSADRKPIGRASVELIFDNSLGTASGQWSTYAEISIKRVIQRNGNSTYYINNTHVRRRDITDIFLGTGIGGRGYAIIEQGMISRIIEAKPQELKVFLEEAAGISKYQERRHETELRLADTRKNLLRIEDIHQELTVQLEHLEAQAKIANQYTEIQKKLHTAQSILWLLRKQEAVAQRVRAENKIQQLEQALEIETSNSHHAEKELEAVRIQEHVASETLHQTQGQLYASNAEVARVEQEIQHLRQNRERLAQQVSDIEKQLEHNKEKKQTAAEHLDKWRQEYQSACLAHEVNLQKSTTANEKLPEVEATTRLHQETLSNCQNKLLLAEQASHLQASHHTHTTKTIQQLESRQDRLAQELNNLPSPDYDTLTHSKQEMADVKTTQEQKKLILSQTEAQLSTAISEQEQASNKRLALQQALTQSKARFDALQSLQLKIENNEALTTWLAQHQFDILPRLWQNIQIEQNWENALEAILRERLNSTGFPQLEVIHDWANDIPPGKWTLFETNQQALQNTTITQTNSENRKTLLEYLTCNNAEIQSVLNEWLDKVFVIESLQAGLSHRSKLASGEILVTSEGHIFTRYSLTYYTPDSQLHGVLTRQQELNEIDSNIKRLDNDLSAQNTILVRTKQTCQTLNESVKDLRQNNEKLQQQSHSLQLTIIKLTQFTEQVDQRRLQIDEELKEIKQQLAAETLHQNDATTKLTEHKKQIDELNKQVQHAQHIWETTDQSLATQRQLVQNIMKEMHESTLHVETCKNKINEIEQTIKVIDEDNENLEASQHKLLAEKNTQDDSSANNQLQIFLTQRITLEQSIITARNNLESTSNQLQKIESTRIASEQKSHTLRESINQTRLKEQEAQITEDRFDEQLIEAKIDEQVLLPLINNQRPATLQTDINQFNANIAALGAVNLAALEELEASQARAAGLDAQLQDLNEAISTLENVIGQIDQETKERLQETFNTVNDHLNELFPIIFAGGQAKLTLNDGEILDSGVLLTAQPPGKKNSSIHLLSGGEKALTALALVFSLFRLNPAPFCLLDEVDAPLDDSNTGRFCDLVKKMSKQTQFLFISHNKITMEIAQQLVGVTMQEQGVSRVVAVDIAEAIKFGNKDNIAI